jgi:hypothetical protein
VPWVQMTEGPTEVPRLREATNGASLIASGTHSSPLSHLAKVAASTPISSATPSRASPSQLGLEVRRVDAWALINYDPSYKVMRTHPLTARAAVVLEPLDAAVQLGECGRRCSAG